eukprot:GFYU01002636.1.p1 GENE.GFYU01002636.1~~GFYU01002636.1.p1  ORF type:complete len:208 (-),score=24.92 GFYU01002636.1:212-835(-)
MSPYIDTPTMADYLFKFVLVGRSGVGKSALVERFAANTFNPTHILTIGAEIKVKSFDIDGQICKFQLWATPGQDAFAGIVQFLFRGAHGCVFVFDVNDLESLEDIRDRWYPLFAQQYSNAWRPQCLLVGNKCDQPRGDTSCYEQAEKIAREFGMPFVTTSALSDQNVDEAFFQICSQAKNAVDPWRGTPVTAARRGVFACVPSCFIV